MEPVIEQQFLLDICNPRLLEEDGHKFNTYDCHLDEFNLPMTDYIISPELKSWEEVEEFISTNIKEYPFIKTCYASPKDWINPIFTDVKTAIYALQYSQRTCNFLLEHCNHIVMNKTKKIYLSI